MEYKYKITNDNLIEFYKIVFMKNAYLKSLIPKTDKNILLIMIVNQLAENYSKSFKLYELFKQKKTFTEREGFFEDYPYIDKNNFSDYKYLVWHIGGYLSLYLRILYKPDINYDPIEFYKNDRSDLKISFY